MRNIYYSYKLCKNIEKNMEVHSCDDGQKCPARGEAGTMRYVNAKRANKTWRSKSKEPVTEFVNWLRFETFAEAKGYIKNYWCSSIGTNVSTITDKGIQLTDNALLPFTPIGLWKEIWREHKIFFTIVPSIVTLLTGLGAHQMVQWVIDRF